MVARVADAQMLADAVHLQDRARICVSGRAAGHPGRLYYRVTVGGLWSWRAGGG